MMVGRCPKHVLLSSLGVEVDHIMIDVETCIIIVVEAVS